MAVPYCSREFGPKPVKERLHFRDAGEPVSRPAPAGRANIHGDSVAQSGESRLIHLIVAQVHR
jgi:hypothetical protein